MTTTAGPTPSPLLSAKQQVPRAPAGAVVRERLRQLLDGAEAARLTVVVAPAGWGKSTLLSQWAADPGSPGGPPGCRWTRPTTSRSGSGATCSAPCGAVAPELVARSSGALAAPGLDPVDVVLPTLLNELDRATERYLLVLDDYHLITDRRVHEQLEFLIGYLPPSLHLVIAGRYDPPLPLARMRARGQLTEIRADDLRFSPDEAAQLVAGAGVAELGGPAMASVVRRTEGWAAGLRLAALAVRAAPDPDARALALRGDDRHVLDFFVAEVLDQVTEEERDLLVACAALDRLSGPLCDEVLGDEVLGDEVLGRTGSAAVLAELERRGVFVTALDAQREWFRCHQLLRDVLLRQLRVTGPATERALLVRAAGWFRAHGQREDAVRLLLAADEHAAAAALLAESVVWFVVHGATTTYCELGERLDPAIARADPVLCMAMAGTAAMTGQADRVRDWLVAAEPQLTPDTPPLDGWHSMAAAAAAIRSSVEQAWTSDIDGAIADARRAIELETDPGSRGYAIVRVALGRALFGAGRHEEAALTLIEAWRLPQLAIVTPVLRLQAAGMAAIALVRAGGQQRARELIAEVAGLAEQLERAWGDAVGPALTLLRTAEGQLAVAAGDPATACAVLTRAVELARVWGHSSYLVAALVARAEAELAGGARSTARSLLNEAHEVADHEPVLPVARDALAAAEARVGRRVVVAARREQQLLVEELTDRELSILRALRGPLTQREIGAELFISMNTVKGYTKCLYRKLGVPGRTEAVARGHELGLI